MSLLLDALKKAAEKNALNEKKGDATHVDLTESATKTEIVDETEILSAATDATQALINEEIDAENLTEFELAEIIKAQKQSALDSNDDDKTEIVADKTQFINQDSEQEPNLGDDETVFVADSDDTDINANKLSFEEVEDNSSLLAEADEDPSLKLALSDEEILLTDDDVTEFLGGDELYTVHADSETEMSLGLALKDASELNLEDQTSSVNLNQESFQTPVLGENDTTYSPDNTSTTSNLGQTTNLNALTNDTAINAQDLTSTQTLAPDDYDRTLVKIDEDVSKVFTGLKSNKSGAAMTPDFAKKVFLTKSSSLRKQNYKIYAVISFVLLAMIAVFSLFEMQSQIEDIDNSLVYLKRNPVPSELRFKKPDAEQDDFVVLEGRVDTEALALLKSLTDKSKVENQQVTESSEQVKINSIDSKANTSIEMTAEDEGGDIEPIAAVDEPKKAIKKIIKQKKSSRTKRVFKSESSAISIEIKLAASKESQLLKSAYSSFEKGDIDAAASDYKKVLEKNRASRDALLGQAAIYASQNENNKALANYQILLQENPKDSLAMASLIAVSQMSPIESESRLKLLQRESPDATYLQFALGNVISAQNRWQEAQQYYFSAYQSEPDNPDYAYNLAVSLEQINKPDVAVNYYGQAVDNSLSHPTSFNVAVVKARIEELSQ